MARNRGFERVFRKPSILGEPLGDFTGRGDQTDSKVFCRTEIWESGEDTTGKILAVCVSGRCHASRQDASMSFDRN